MNEVSSMIDEFGKDVTLRRQSGSGSIVDYEFNAAATADTIIKMFIHPASGKDLLILPEGERTKTVMIGYCYDPVYLASKSDQKNSDRIVDGSTIYEIKNIQFYEAQNLSIQPYYRCTLVEVNS